MLCGWVFKKSPQHIKNFGIWLCYACHGTDNVYRESTGSGPPLGHETQCLCSLHPELKWKTAVPAASNTGWMSSSSTTPRSSFHCPSVCCVWHQHKPRLTTKMPKTFFYAQRPLSKNPESRKVLKVQAIKKAKHLRAHCSCRGPGSVFSTHMEAHNQLYSCTPGTRHTDGCACTPAGKIPTVINRL